MSANLVITHPHGRQAVRLGPNGSASFVAEQLIAAFALRSDVDARVARKVRRWIVYSGGDHLIAYRTLTTTEAVRAAIGDSTDHQSWVRCDRLAHVDMEAVEDAHLRALLLLWQMATHFYAWDLTAAIPTPLPEAVQASALALDDVGAPFAPLALEIAEAFMTAPGGSRFSFG